MKVGRAVYFEPPEACLINQANRGAGQNNKVAKPTAFIGARRRRVTIDRLRVRADQSGVWITAEANVVTVVLPSGLGGLAGRLPSGFSEFAPERWRALVVPPTVAGGRALFHNLPGSRCRCVFQRNDREIGGWAIKADPSANITPSAGRRMMVGLTDTQAPVASGRPLPESGTPDCDRNQLRCDPAPASAGSHVKAAALPLGMLDAAFTALEAEAGASRPAPDGQQLHSDGEGASRRKVATAAGSNFWNWHRAAPLARTRAPQALRRKEVGLTRPTSMGTGLTCRFVIGALLAGLLQVGPALTRVAHRKATSISRGLCKWRPGNPHLARSRHGAVNIRHRSTLADHGLAISSKSPVTF